ncbi:MAG: hypothetical protein ACH34Y_00030 [Brachymonas sp.]|jgi:hypothetical protein
MNTVSLRLLSGCFTGLILAAASPLAMAQAPRHQDIESIATIDVTLYICAKAHPSGLTALKAKLEKNLQTMSSPAPVLRAAKSYSNLYNSQLNAMLEISKQERTQFCKEAAL